MEKRQAEIAGMKVIAEFLCNTYPQFFELAEYTHPVKGVCTSLVLKNYESTQIDVSNIDTIRFNLESYRLVIVTTQPVNTYTFNKFIVDESVI
jgi:hypothetical protein